MTGRSGCICGSGALSGDPRDGYRGNMETGGVRSPIIIMEHPLDIEIGGRGGIFHSTEDRTFTIKELLRLTALSVDF